MAGVCWWLFRAAVCFSDFPSEPFFAQGAAAFKFVIFKRLQVSTSSQVLNLHLNRNNLKILILEVGLFVIMMRGDAT